jgi:RimJ/RimL family protein N-acetyltransferase
VRHGLELRVPTDADAASWTTLFDDDEVMRFIGNGQRRDHAYYVSLVERQRSLAADSGLCLFSVVVDGEVAGFAGVHPWSHEWGPTGLPEIGWRLGRAFWGRGVATQAARAMVERARAAEVPRLISMIHESNAASFRVARKLGMATEDVLVSPEGNPVHQLGLALQAPRLRCGSTPGRRT